MTSSPGPLASVRVLELAGLGPAQLGAMLLADLGADVIRVDRPSDVPAAPRDGHSPELLARGRRSIAIDLKARDAKEVLRGLIERADVLIDPYRPGVVERLGLGPDACMECNPRLILARMTGWGQSGPLARAAGHDINYIGLAGALQPLGDADRVPPVPLNLVGDFGGGGMLLAFGVVAALYERAGSDQGQIIDAAMVDGVASLMTSICQLHASGRWTHERGAHWLQGAAPWYGVYRTADGKFATVGSLEPQFYERLLGALGLDPADWPQWDRARWPAMARELEAIFGSRTLAEWQADLEGTDACFAPALTFEEAADHPQIAARGTYTRVAGALQPAPAPRFARTPGAIGRPPPWPGEHTAEVAGEAGIGEARYKTLVAEGVLHECPQPVRTGPALLAE